MGGSGENRPLVALQNGQPIADISSMILADVRRDAEIGAQERRPKLCHQFLGRIAFIAPALAPEVAVKTALVLRPVGALMR